MDVAFTLIIIIYAFWSSSTKPVSGLLVSLIIWHNTKPLPPCMVIGHGRDYSACENYVHTSHACI